MNKRVPPAYMTHLDVRRWLHNLGLKGTRLPKDTRVLYVEQPGLGVWKIVPQDSGFLVSPYTGSD